ncbi:GntR family transcriptional regulator [Paenibacillus larvae]|uniref:GntR family transcriptional regulator n=1 Tax=Paenibacillus larvae TaxID=1464 RepID=UPI00285409DB|nr:GntR family transcriptional regulator [Paenibacillus larvae]MDR5599464.1 GntR family transcriptional regulator [Paenibacillus larvae]
MKHINKHSRIPLYIQLMDILIEEMENELGEHEQLSPEREICSKYDVSRTTVRQAINELERDGYIYKVQGKGTFVSPKRVKQDLIKFYSFTEEMKKQGKIPFSKVLTFEVVEADRKLSGKLSIAEGSKVYVFSRLRLADNVPMMLGTSYVPYDLFPGISKRDLETTALYDLFTKHFHTSITKAEELFTPVMTRAHEARLLNMPDSIPSLRIERFTYMGNQIIEYTNTIARGDKFKYRVSLEN